MNKKEKIIFDFFKKLTKYCDNITHYCDGCYFYDEALQECSFCFMNIIDDKFILDMIDYIESMEEN